MVHNLTIDKQYKKWIIELKDKIRTTQIKRIWDSSMQNAQ
jgi:hypothetical protein